MNLRWIYLGALVVVAVGALALRVPRLGERAMHTDEAIHADKFKTLWEDHTYTYDPTDYHGPTLNYFTLPVMWLSGTREYGDTSEWTYRLVPVIFGMGLILLLGLVGDGLGRAETIVAGILTAISPAMVFYSRYYIQEMLLVFFTFGLMAAAWRYSQSRRLGWAILAGMFVGLMHATKETWVIAGGSMVVAWGLAVGWKGSGFRVQGSGAGVKGGRVWGAHLALGAMAAAVVAIVLLSGFFTNLRGPLDSVLTYGGYFHRGAGGSDHNHPWDYYLRVLFWYRYGSVFRSEMLIGVLAVVGFVAAMSPATRAWGRGWGRRRGSSVDLGLTPQAMGFRRCAAGTAPAEVDSGPTPGDSRFRSFAAGTASTEKSYGGAAGLTFRRSIAFYTIAMLAVYSAISYKTPWCALGFLHGMILLAGIGAVEIVQCCGRAMARWAVVALLALAAAQLAWQSYQTNYIHVGDDRYTPYLYASPSSSIRDLAPRVRDIAVASPAGNQMVISVVAPRYWPVPWYLRRFERVGYPAEPTTDDLRAGIILADAAQSEDLEKQLGDRYVPVTHYGLHRGVVLVLYVRQDLWHAYLRGRGLE